MDEEALTQIEYKQKKYQELINQIEASLDFAKGE